MWTYDQASGQIAHDALIAAVGYSGAEECKNDPNAQCVHNKGPLPRGDYEINAPVDTKTHGPFVMWLTPFAENEMCGRSAFGIHGDSVTHPGTASEGCIILPRMVRERIWNSGDRKLRVI